MELFFLTFITGKIKFFLDALTSERFKLIMSYHNPFQIIIFQI